jgi:hypothetical protein
VVLKVGVGSCSRLNAQHQPRFGSRFCSWPLWPAEPSRELAVLGSLHNLQALGSSHALQVARSGFASCSAGRSGLGSLCALQVDLGRSAHQSQAYGTVSCRASYVLQALEAGLWSVLGIRGGSSPCGRP